MSHRASSRQFGGSLACMVDGSPPALSRQISKNHLRRLLAIVSSRRSSEAHTWARFRSILAFGAFYFNAKRAERYPGGRAQ